MKTDPARNRCWLGLVEVCVAEQRESAAVALDGGFLHPEAALCADWNDRPSLLKGL